MSDLFIECPHCKKVVSKKDHAAMFYGRYKIDLIDTHTPIPCFHCGRTSYIQEWKKTYGTPKIRLSDDLFEV